MNCLMLKLCFTHKNKYLFVKCICQKYQSIMCTKNSKQRYAYLWGQVDLHGCVWRPVAHSEDVHSKFYVAWLTLVLYILSRNHSTFTIQWHSTEGCIYILETWHQYFKRYTCMFFFKCVYVQVPVWTGSLCLWTVPCPWTSPQAYW